MKKTLPYWCLVSCVLVSLHGCAWINFTANDSLGRNPRFKETKEINTICVASVDKNPKVPGLYQDFIALLSKSLPKRGYSIVSDINKADLFLELRAYSYYKKKGLLYFWFLVFPHEDLVDGIRKTPGLRIRATFRFKTYIRSKWYQAYDDDYDINNTHDKIVEAILQDLDMVKQEGVINDRSRGIEAGANQTAAP
jgi:hypothetical protein